MSSCEPIGKIGILSGVGPLAGAYVLEEVIQYAAKNYGAIEDNAYPDIMLVSHGVSGVGNQAEPSEIFEQEMIAGVKKLEQMGATHIGIACNTAHLYLASITNEAKADLVNIIEETAIAASSTDKKYLLLTSRSSREQRLHESYFKKYSVTYAYVGEQTQEKLDAIIGLVMAYDLQKATQLMDEILAEAKKTGFDAVVAGCTELPIALRHAHNKAGMHVLDSSHILAKALIDKTYTQLNI